MSRNLVIPNLVNILNATSLVLPFPELGTVDQNNAIESESDEIKEICVNHYNASVLINPNQTSKRKPLPSNFTRPTVLSTCARSILTEDRVASRLGWSETQKEVLELDHTREIAQRAANKLHIEAAHWLFNFVIEKLSPKDTKIPTSLQNALGRVTFGHFYTAWYKLYYECHPKMFAMFDMSKAEFHRIAFPPDKDLNWLETEINTKRFHWEIMHDGQDVGEEECLKAVLFAVCSATGLEDLSKRLQHEIQNNPTMTAHAALQFSSVYIKSKKTSERLQADAKAFASQVSTSSASHILGFLLLV